MKDQAEAIKKLQEDNKSLTKRLYEAEHVLKSLNIAIIGIAYTMKVNAKRIEAADADAFLKYIEEHVHPVIRRSDQLTSEIADKAKKDIAKKAKKAKEDENGA